MYLETYLTRRSKIRIHDDPVFKTVFADGTEQSRRNAAFMIETFLHIEVNSIEEENTEGFSLGFEGKQIRYDSVFRVNDNIKVIIEMQNKWEETNNQRYNHYANLAGAKRVKRGGSYMEGSVYIITILNHRLLRGHSLEDDVRIYRRMEDGTMYCCDEVIAPVEIAGISDLWKKDIEELTTAECLKLWMKYSHEVKYMDKMKKIRKKEEKIDMLETKVEQIVNSDNEFIVLKHRVDAYYAEKQKQIDKMKAEMFEKQCEEKEHQLILEQQLREEKDRQLVLEQQLREVKERKLAEEHQLRKEKECKLAEEQQKMAYTVTNLHANGFSTEDIIKFTGLKLDEVEIIISAIQHS